MELVHHAPRSLTIASPRVLGTTAWALQPMSSDQDFDTFFAHNFDRLVRSLTAVTGDAELARDSVQEAFIKAYSRWPRVRRYDDPMLWVRRVAINKSLDTRRSFLRRRARESRFEDPEVTSRVEEWEPQSEVDVAELLRDLSPRQRAVIVLFYLDDLPMQEIAATLDISIGAVKFHLHKARARLRQNLGAQEEVPRD